MVFHVHRGPSFMVLLAKLHYCVYYVHFSTVLAKFEFPFFWKFSTVLAKFEFPDLLEKPAFTCDCELKIHGP